MNRKIPVQRFLPAGLLLLLLFMAMSIRRGTASNAVAEAEPGTMTVNWIAGAPECAQNDEVALQVHRYDEGTYIFRQNPCLTFEAPFNYLLIGRTRALLWDTGAIADEESMPLAATVMQLLARPDGSRPSLIVAHSHSHRDHRAGDGQFAGLADVEIVGPDLADVQAFFHLNRWPEGVAQLDLGGRLLEFTPVPGHHPAGIALYDQQTGLLLTGDFLLPGRIYVDDVEAFRASSRRLRAFAEERSVSLVLGGHLEMDSEGDFYRPGATYHPDERDLHLLPQDVEALAAATDSLARFLPYRAYANFALVNYEVMLPALGVLLLALTFPLALGWRFIRNRRRR